MGSALGPGTPVRCFAWRPRPATVPMGATEEGCAMSDEREFQPGEILRIRLPDSDEELQFVISDVRDDGGVETMSLIPDPENSDTALPWE
jgi:hypothetical protein